ncbi:hypothetical protein HS048_35515 [Planomonospora sp. ID91781]|uniref:DUF6283 family protein n=1 Tax=Planomonospora sp. ID91781 TaxID=2738135 RepID=UPI0018C3C1C2|nr:DUF6283 family protein [Planomonospora sp. ID91781]MBG0825982.1 hypothetical protein [Planomonospora sp. ID91781]
MFPPKPLPDAIACRIHPCTPYPRKAGNPETYRYGGISAYLAEIGEHTTLGADAVGCHTSERTPVELCAAWLRVEGAEHPGVQAALAAGRLAPHTLQPRDGGPELFASRLEMLAAHAATSRRPSASGSGTGSAGEA